MYDADDALGKSFAKEVTWEILFRLDNQRSQAVLKPSKAIISSQESGGWSIIHTSGVGIQLEYTTSSNKVCVVSASEDNIVTGRFYHIVATVNKTTNFANIYINGKQMAKDVSIPAGDFQFGNFGNPRRQKNMWLCLGGDNATGDVPGDCQLSSRTTFVFANIYNKALSNREVEELYDDDVRFYTEPVKPSLNNDLILDAVFGKDGSANDVSPYRAHLDINRKPKTSYNTQQRRYEAIRDSATYFDFYCRDYAYDPSITAQLGEAFSFEIYCQNSASADQCVISNQEEGGAGMQFTKSYPSFVCNTFGYHSNTSKMGSGKSTVTSKAIPSKYYNHYIGTYDRNNKKTKLYINGISCDSASMDAGDNLCFPFAGFQWLGIMADTRANVTHESSDFPFMGRMSVGRVWGKALTDSDVSELYAQAKSVSRTVTISSAGYVGLCLPFAAVIPEGTKAYGIVSAGSNAITLGLLADAGEAVAYGTPFILKGAVGEYTVNAADVSAATLHSQEGNPLEGTLIAKSVDAYRFSIGTGGASLTYIGKTNYSAASAFLPYAAGMAKTLSIVLSDSIIPQAAIASPADTVTGDNISGHITCNGAGVAGVKVSDGFTVVKTDASGFYSFRSNKKNGYVFYTVPSGYMPYEEANAPVEDKIFVPFWQALDSESPNTAEVHDFKLRSENNDEFYFLAGADSHLANRYNDLVQFSKGYIERLKEEKKIADDSNVPIYSTILGDNAWDTYWYGNNYSLKNFRSTLADYGYCLPLFPCMGNHDNDGATPYTDSTDFEASAPFRKIISPNYYSFDLGKVHFVILDDIFYINSGIPSGTACAGSRNYKGFIPDYQLEWLRQDLADVDKDTPVFIGLHIPVWKRNTVVLEDCSANLIYEDRNSTEELCNIVKDYKTVHIISGHTHWNHHYHPAEYPNIHEDNIAAICAIWWYSGYKTGWHNCRDGVPGGYEMFHIKGKDITYSYHSIEHNGDAQFHVLDVNTVKQYYNDNMSDFLVKYPAFTDFGKWDDNQLLINVFSYDTDWKIEIVEDGEQLEAQRLYIEDPYHMLTYDIPYFKSGSNLGSDARATKNSHMFKVQCKSATSPVTVRVTDSFGTTYQQVVNRPVPFALTSIDTANTIVTGIKETRYVPADGIEVCGGNGNIRITVQTAAMAQIVGLDGTYKTVRLAEGTNDIPVGKRGVYVVRINGASKKLFVK